MEAEEKNTSSPSHEAKPIKDAREALGDILKETRVGDPLLLATSDYAQLVNVTDIAARTNNILRDNDTPITTLNAISAQIQVAVVRETIRNRHDTVPGYTSSWAVVNTLGESLSGSNVQAYEVAEMFNEEVNKVRSRGSSDTAANQ